MAKKSKEGPNKSQAIRDYQAQNPKAKPAEVAEALKAQGLTVSAAYVSTIKTMAKKKTRKKARQARSTETVAAPASKAGSLSLDTLIAAKKLAGQLGGVAQAKAALDALARLGL